MLQGPVTSLLGAVSGNPHAAGEFTGMVGTVVLAEVASGFSITQDMSLAQKIGVRQNLARAFLQNAGVSNIERHLAAIDFNNPVFTRTLEKGSNVYRYSEIGATDPKHYFFEEELTSPGEVGKPHMFLDPTKYQKEIFTLQENIKVLESTTNLGGKSGARQIFSTKIESKSTCQPIKY